MTRKAVPMVLQRDIDFSGCSSVAQPRFASIQIRLLFFYCVVSTPALAHSERKSFPTLTGTRDVGSGRRRTTWVHQEART